MKQDQPKTDGNPPSDIFGASVNADDVAHAPAVEGLTDLQSRFVWAFILTGGKAERSAELAGYGGGAKNMAFRNLAKRKVQDAIAERLKLQPGSALAMAVGAALRVIERGSDERAIVAAAFGLMDRFGMAPPRGPAVAVQINNNVGSQEAQSILADVAAARAARLAGPSDIPPAMPDATMLEARRVVGELAALAGDGTGGVVDRGSRRVPSVITPPSPARVGSVVVGGPAEGMFD